jgi:hypothetical protein
MFMTCHVQDFKKNPHLLEAMKIYQHDMKNRLGFVNLDGSKGINVHLPDTCTDLDPKVYNFSGALPEKTWEAISGTSLGRYITGIEEPDGSKLHVQIIGASLDGTQDQKEGYVAFPIPHKRMAVTSLGDLRFPDEDIVMDMRHTIHHEVNRLFGIDTSGEPFGIYDTDAAYDRLKNVLDSKKENGEPLFRW